MAVFMTISKDKTTEVLGQERRRRWSVEEKRIMVRESLEPGQSVSVTGRRTQPTVPLKGALQGGSLSALNAREPLL